jgi:hypothetical protein
MQVTLCLLDLMSVRTWAEKIYSQHFFNNPKNCEFGWHELQATFIDKILEWRIQNTSLERYHYTNLFFLLTFLFVLPNSTLLTL